MINCKAYNYKSSRIKEGIYIHKLHGLKSISAWKSCAIKEIACLSFIDIKPISLSSSLNQTLGIWFPANSFLLIIYLCKKSINSFLLSMQLYQNLHFFTKLQALRYKGYKCTVRVSFFILHTFSTYRFIIM